MNPVDRTEPPKARLLFAATACAIGVAAFAFGYRTPEPLGAAAANAVRPVVGNVPTDAAAAPKMSRSFATTERKGLQVEGFAKIGFAEMEELLTTASPQELEHWARQLGALPEQPLKAIAMVAFYTAWLDFAPDEALRSLRDFPDLLSRRRVFFMLVSAVPPTVLPQLVELVSEFSESERRTLLPSFLAALAETDPLATARFLDAQPTLVSAFDAEALISTWAGDDVAAATQWLEASQFISDSGALRSLVSRWLAKDAAGAQDFVLRYRKAVGIEEAAQKVVSHLLSNSPGQAQEFLRSFSEERAQSVLLGMIASAEENQLAVMVESLSALPESFDQAALGYALGRWNEIDSAQAVAWLQAQPAARRESLLIPMIQATPGPTSLELVSLAFKISDAQVRNEALRWVAASFRDETAAKVAEQIRALGLPVSHTDHLLQLRAAIERDAEAPGDH